MYKWVPMNMALCAMAIVTKSKQNWDQIDPLQFQAFPSGNGSKSNKTQLSL